MNCVLPVQERARLERVLSEGGPTDGRSMQERLQEVEEEIEIVKDAQELWQGGIREEEKAIEQSYQEEDKGVWRVWSASHC